MDLTVTYLDANEIFFYLITVKSLILSRMAIISFQDHLIAVNKAGWLDQVIPLPNYFVSEL